MIFPRTDFDEHMIVERKDGRLWMLARTMDGISESTSSDQGVTWSEPKPSSVQNPSSRFFIRRLASGNLIFVKNGPPTLRLPNRSNLSAYLSEDDGKSWGAGLLIDDRAAVSYPDGFQTPDGDIHLLYDWNRHTDAEILHTKFRESDFGDQARATPLRIPKKSVVNKAGAPELPKSIKPDVKSTAQAIEDAKQDFKSIAHEGVAPNQLVCDTSLRELPHGSWILFMLAGGPTEPSPLNYTRVTRSSDQGKNWTPLTSFDVGFPCEGKTISQVPTELMIRRQSSTLFFPPIQITGQMTGARGSSPATTHSRPGASPWKCQDA